MTSYDIDGDTYTFVKCCDCGVRYLIPNIIHQTALNNRGHGGRRIYCPNGHSWHFLGESDADKLRRELNTLMTEKWTAEERAAKAETALERWKKRAKKR